MLTKGERYLRLQEDIVNLRMKYAQMIVSRVLESQDDMIKAQLDVFENLQHFLFEAALAQADVYNQDI